MNSSALQQLREGVKDQLTYSCFHLTLSTIHHLINPFRWGLRGREAEQGKTSPTEQREPNHTGKHISHRGETLSPRLPEALLLLPSWPAASSQVQSFSPLLVASLDTFKFHPWGQGQMSAWVLTKVFL